MMRSAKTDLAGRQRLEEKLAAGAADLLTNRFAAIARLARTNCQRVGGDCNGARSFALTRP